MGILGIKYSQNIEKAKLLILFTVIIIAFSIGSIIFIHSALGEVFFFLSYFIWFIGFIPTILFLIGAYMNLKAKGGN